MQESQMYTLIAEELELQWNQVKNTIELLDLENTVPFIARYRKELTGSLDEEKIRAILDRIRYLRHLEERKQTVIKSIGDQGKLTKELEEKILGATKLQEVEDLYLPFKPKRRTRATIAKEKGLQSLADIILDQKIVDGDIEIIVRQYVNQEKGVSTVEEALAGARDIVAEIISDDANIRQRVRVHAQEKGVLFSEARNLEIAEYEIYKDFSEPLKTIPAYRILAINRGEKENYLRAGIEVPEIEALKIISDLYILNEKCIFTDHLKIAIADAYQRLVAPAIEREVRALLTEKADEHAINIFARNLRALLMTPPLKDKVICGIDPGYRTGCKVAVIDATGKYLDGVTIYPHPPQKEWKEAKGIIQELVEKHGVQVIAIGNGTASRETEQLVAEFIGEFEEKIQYTIVNEAGASVYSASPLAKKEFPDLEASMRGNISIARRLLDPLSELVKIDPKSIGVGLYQHDVNQARLSEALDFVVESAVNQVGVNLNTASPALLRYIAGINSRVAENIVSFREEFGQFSSREDLKKVKGFGSNSFLQAAGFLRLPNADYFFDSTAVHPESYQAAKVLLKSLGLTTMQVKNDGYLIRQKIKNEKRSIVDLAKICGCGQETLTDIIDSLEKPNRDPRNEMPNVVLRSDVLSINDLSVGMVLKGTVRNVVDFGAFVDIGVKQDGLVHLSQMAKRYVKNPLDIVSVGDVLDVRVININIEKGRIALSMILD